MQPESPFTFHVIYVPGTVRILAPFVRSLAEHSSYRFRLVANGCSAAEESLLAAEASRHARLELKVLETRTVLLHGDALQRCFTSDNGEYFAFIDSDIFARGPFLTDAQSLLATHTALFSGLPCWLTPEESVMPPAFAFMSGRFSSTDRGRCLGVSYCALYRRRAVEAVMAHTGVTFHARQWFDLSSSQRSLLSSMQLAKRRYDTGKLVNLMLLQAGHGLAMAAAPNLIHVGALSSEAMRPPNLVIRLSRRLREIVDANRPAAVPRRGALERTTTQTMFARRQKVEAYFQYLLAGGTADGGPAQAFPSSVRPQIIEAGVAYLALRNQ